MAVILIQRPTSLLRWATAVRMKKCVSLIIRISLLYKCLSLLYVIFISGRRCKVWIPDYLRITYVQYGGVFSKKAYEEYGEDYGTSVDKIVSSGPYVHAGASVYHFSVMAASCFFSSFFVITLSSTGCKSQHHTESKAPVYTGPARCNIKAGDWFQ